jgi:hypothetical protein
MTVTTDRRQLLPAQPTSGVQLARARGPLDIDLRRRDGLVACEVGGWEFTLDAGAAEQLGRCLLEAVADLAASRRRKGCLHAIGVVPVRVDGQQQQVEVDAVRDAGEQQHAVLLTIDALGLDGVFDEAAARQLGELLLQR